MAHLPLDALVALALGGDLIWGNGSVDTHPLVIDHTDGLRYTNHVTLQPDKRLPVGSLTPTTAGLSGYPYTQFQAPNGADGTFDAQILLADWSTVASYSFALRFLKGNSVTQNDWTVVRRGPQHSCLPAINRCRGHLLGAAGRRKQLRTQGGVGDVVGQVPEGHRGVRLAPTEARAESNGGAPLLLVGQAAKDGVDHLAQLLRRVGVLEEGPRITVDGGCLPGDQVAEVGREDGVFPPLPFGSTIGGASSLGRPRGNAHAWLLSAPGSAIRYPTLREPARVRRAAQARSAEVHPDGPGAGAPPGCAD
ncbi:MAG: hypothetical protein AB1505_22295 [Candidatus Latescibacterota bacterium]